MNGEYYAKGRAVFKSPTRTENPDGSQNISLGFRVCDLVDGVSDDGAEEIARALNTPPETAEKAAAFFDAIAGAKVHGKEWWAYSQMAQIEMHIAQDKRIKALEAELALYRFQPIDTLPAQGLVIVGSFNARGKWCSEVASVVYVREHLAKIAAGAFKDSPHLAWEYTHWASQPAEPAKP